MICSFPSTDCLYLNGPFLPSVRSIPYHFILTYSVVVHSIPSLIRSIPTLFLTVPLLLWTVPLFSGHRALSPLPSTALHSTPQCLQVQSIPPLICSFPRPHSLPDPSTSALSTPVHSPSRCSHSSNHDEDTSFLLRVRLTSRGEHCFTERWTVAGG